MVMWWSMRTALKISSVCWKARSSYIIHVMKYILGIIAVILALVLAYHVGQPEYIPLPPPLYVTEDEENLNEFQRELQREFDSLEAEWVKDTADHKGI